MTSDEFLLPPARAALSRLAVLADLGQRNADGTVWTTADDIVLSHEVSPDRIVIAGRGHELWLATVTAVLVEDDRTIVHLTPIPRAPTMSDPADVATQAQEAMYTANLERSQLIELVQQLRAAINVAVYEIAHRMSADQRRSFLRTAAWQHLEEVGRIPPRRASCRADSPD